MTKFHAEFTNFVRIWLWSTDSWGCGPKTAGCYGV